MKIPDIDMLGFEMVKAHREAAMEESSISTATLINAWEGSGSITQAIAAATLTTGGKHAPIAQTMKWISGGPKWLSFWGSADRVPGFGSSFVQGYDERWALIDDLVERVSPDVRRMVQDMQNHLHDRGKFVYPNPACWTACYAIIMEIPPALSPYLFVEMRLGAWYRIIRNREQDKKNK